MPCSLCGEEFVDNVTVDVGQPAVNAVMAEGEFFMVDAELMENGGVQVVTVGRIGGRFVRPFIALAVGDAAFEAGTSDPTGEGEWIVVASFAALAAGHASEFGG